MSPIAIMQSNITFGTQHGFLTDAYRDSDKRPDSRQAKAWLTRYNLYLESIDAALHLDYRLFGDSWSIRSHMVEAALYQSFLTRFTLRPSIRYYTQTSADFYSYSGAPKNSSEDFFFDQRLSTFGGITAGLKLITEIGEGFSSSVGFDYLTQSSGLALGSSNESTKRDSLDAQFWFVEITKKF